MVLRHVERLVEVKEQAKEEAAQLNMEGELELNKVNERPGKHFGKVKNTTNPGSRPHP